MWTAVTSDSGDKATGTFPPIKRRPGAFCQSDPMLRPSVIWQSLGIALGLLGLILVAWSGWLYHFAAVADTTDETSTFWIGAGSFILFLACGTLVLALHYFRRGRRRAPEHTVS